MIPTITNPMGINPTWKRLLDANTRFLIWGNLTDRTGNVEITNHGLVNDGKWISSPDTTSYAVIPANSLPSDVFCTDHDWSFEIKFYVPDNWSSGLTRRVGVFGYFGYPRLDMLLLLNNTLSFGGMIDELGGLVVPGINEVILNYKYGTGFSVILNKVLHTSGQDTTTPRNIRVMPLGILANLLNSTTTDSYAYMMKINYIRISNITR